MATFPAACSSLGLFRHSVGNVKLLSELFRTEYRERQRWLKCGMEKGGEERRIMSVADRTEAGSGRRYHFVETRCQSAPYLFLMGNVLNSLEISLYFPS